MESPWDSPRIHVTSPSGGLVTWAALSANRDGAPIWDGLAVRLSFARDVCAEK